MAGLSLYGIKKRRWLLLLFLLLLICCGSLGGEVDAIVNIKVIHWPSKSDPLALA